MTETDASMFTRILRKFFKTDDTVSLPTVINTNSDYYYMGHCRRGSAIIFNHFEFDQDLIKRYGTKKDAKNIQDVLSELNFDVVVYDDLKFGAIHEILVSMVDHSDEDCLVIVILTHGDRGKLHARDHSYSTDLLWANFTGDKCPTLAGKPKMFFIQACRGDEIDDGVRMRSSTTTDSKPNSYTIPAMADILIMYSCFDNYLSWRHPENGSWFVQSLCEELKTRWKENDLLTILTSVNRTMAIRYKSNVPNNKRMHSKKQVGTIVSTLTRLLYFYPVK